MASVDETLTQLLARSFAMRDAISYLAAILADARGEPEGFLQAMAKALQDRLDDLPHGSSDLKERVRVEADWIVGAAQAFHASRKQ